MTHYERTKQQLATVPASTAAKAADYLSGNPTRKGRVMRLARYLGVQASTAATLLSAYNYYLIGGAK